MGLLQVVSLHFFGWNNNKGMEIYVSLLQRVLIFASCLLLFLYDLVFLSIVIRAKRSIWIVNSQERRVPGSSGRNGRRRKY